MWKTAWDLGVMFRHIHRRARPHFVSSRVKASISTSSSLPAPIPSAVNQASEVSLSQTTTDEMTASHPHPTLPSLSSTQLRAAHHVPQPGYGGQSYVLFDSIARYEANLCYREGTFDTANPPYIRKYLRTYGLTPPRAESYETQKARCMTSAIIK